MLVDASLLLYAVDRSSPDHDASARWLTEQLNRPVRVGLPWESLAAFLRISTHPRASDHPLSPRSAWSFVRDWLDRRNVWIPLPSAEHAELLDELIQRYRLSGNQIPDARLAALAIEHGLILYSADTDFARFSEIRWENPLATG